MKPPFITKGWGTIAPNMQIFFRAFKFCCTENFASLISNFAAPKGAAYFDFSTIIIIIIKLCPE